MMAVAAAQKNREMFAIKKSYSIEVSANERRAVDRGKNPARNIALLTMMMINCKWMWDHLIRAPLIQFMQRNGFNWFNLRA